MDQKEIAGTFLDVSLRGGTKTDTTAQRTQRRSHCAYRFMHESVWFFVFSVEDSKHQIQNTKH